MITVNKILCPVDFFPASDAAVSYAAGLASHYGAAVHLLHVITPILPVPHEYAMDSAEIMKSVQKTAEEEMSQLLTRVREAGAIAFSEIRIGDVYSEIKAAIELTKPDLLVMGTHGRRGVERWFMGSTTEKLMRHSPVPLLTISGSGEKPAPIPSFRKILVTTDFSDGTADALAYAFSVAQENESHIELLHVVNDIAADVSGAYRESLLDGIRKRLEDLVPEEAKPWCDVVTRVETGMAYRIILRHLEEEKVDLLVMNIHGKGMLDRALLGSTAERVVRVSTCPVMLIPPMKRKLKRKARPGGHCAA